MACTYCMEEPDEGKCIRNGCDTCCNCGRQLKPLTGFTQVQLLDAMNIQEIKHLRKANQELREQLDVFRTSCKCNHPATKNKFGEQISPYNLNNCKKE